MVVLVVIGSVMHSCADYALFCGMFVSLLFYLETLMAGTIQDVYMNAYRQTDKQTDGWTGRQAGTHTAIYINHD